MGILIRALLKEGLSYATLAFVVLPFIASLSGKPMPAMAADFSGFSVPSISGIQNSVKNEVNAAVSSIRTPMHHAFGGASALYIGSGPIFLPHN